MRVVLGESAGAARTPEGPSRRHLDRGLPRHVRDEEVHGEVLAVHEGVHGLPDDGGHDVGVDVAVVLVVEGRPGQHHAAIRRQ